MVDRTQRASPFQQLQTRLEIDEDALDVCLGEQPGVFYSVADGYVAAVARRDAKKLELEQKTAVLDEDFRNEAARAETKLTETALQRKLTSAREIQDLERELLTAKAEADKWLALKEAYQQRSFMLRELVSLKVSQMGNLSIERGERRAREDLTQARADYVRRETGRMREERSR